MKYFLLFSGIELTAVLLGYLKHPFSQIPWMSRNYTTALKGLSMLTILWSHVGACCGIRGIQFIGTVGVSLFIIFSGYGLQLSVKTNGLKNYWKRRVLHIMLPYWVVQGIGLMIRGERSCKVYMLDSVLIKPALGSGWFMQYIMICYLLFFLVKLTVIKIKPGEPDRVEKRMLYGLFLTWFVIDSLFFADPAMPFLKARQMLCFPFGVSIAKDRDAFEKMVSKHGVAFFGGVTGLLFMGITQLPAVKATPFIIQNALSLFTVFPLAIAMLNVTKSRIWLLNNWMLEQIGLVSFEIYLVHVFTMETIQASWSSLAFFLGITAVGVGLLHMLIRKGNQIWSI